MKIEELVYDNYRKLNENDIYIWNYILDNKNICRNMSIQELAGNCNVSHTTILRFAHKLGLQGYSELKVYLKWDGKSNYSFNKDEINNTYNDMIKTMDMLRKQDLSEAFEILDNANRIYAYGSGAVQKSSSKEIKRNLLFIGKLVNVLEGRDEIPTIVRNLKEKDVFFLVSLSGENRFINNFAKTLKEKGIKLISITKVGNNELSQISDVNIQFYTHIVATIDEGLEIFPVSQFFLINEFFLLKYLEYKKTQI